MFKFPKDQINTHNIKSDVKHIEEIFSKYNNTWFRKFETYWKPGEPEAKKMLKDFFNNHLSTYKEDRDYLDTLVLQNFHRTYVLAKLHQIKLLVNLNFIQNINLLNMKSIL